LVIIVVHFGIQCVFWIFKLRVWDLFNFMLFLTYNSIIFWYFSLWLFFALCGFSYIGYWFFCWFSFCVELQCWLLAVETCKLDSLLTTHWNHWWVSLGFAMID
jgi:hypothetical protein